MTSILYVGVDVDDNRFTATFINKHNHYHTIKTAPNFKALHKAITKTALPNEFIKVCYEASYLGFSLKRQFDKVGIHCDLIASSQIPVRPSDRIKTDRLDSEKLAKYYKQGLLKIVRAIDEESEGHRLLIRGRNQTVHACKICKQQILSACRCQGIDYRSSTQCKSYWTKGHLAFLNGLLKDDRFNLHFRKDLEYKLYLLATHQGVVKQYDNDIHQLAISKRYRQAVGYLGCIRGIAELTAMTFIVEIGDIHRFAHPRKLMSYAGLSVCEYSSGGKSRKGGVTNMGNKYIRTAAVEACQLAGSRCTVNKALRGRRIEQDLVAIEIGDRCMRRLYKKYHQLFHANKHFNKIKVACARELLGFIWEALHAAAAAELAD